MPPLDELLPLEELEELRTPLLELPPLEELLPDELDELRAPLELLLEEPEELCAPLELLELDGAPPPPPPPEPELELDPLPLALEALPLEEPDELDEVWPPLLELLLDELELL